MGSKPGRLGVSFDVDEALVGNGEETVSGDRSVSIK